MLQKIRDEAHRFAVNFHRNTRSKRMLHTELTDIEGIGNKKAQKLLNIFGSVKKVRESSQKALQEALGPKTGQKVYHYFEQKN